MMASSIFFLVDLAICFLPWGLVESGKYVYQRPLVPSVIAYGCCLRMWSTLQHLSWYHNQKFHLCQECSHYADNEKLVVINTPPCEVIRVSLTHGHEKMSAKVCYEIGNRHAPLFWGENDTFITIYNEPMFVMLQKIHGVQAEKEVLKLDFDRRISASIHNHHH